MGTAETGRFYIKSLKTGKTWCIEPIGDAHIPWGDVNPSTKELEQGNYGQKYKGSIDESESIITKENGYDKIYYTEIGESPISFIERMEKDL